MNADPDTGYFCNPYGPCEAWCALFATWVWERAGVPIPSYAFTGDIYYWAAGPHRACCPPTAAPLPGDAVLYGTGPWSTSSSRPRRPGGAGLAGRGHRHRGGRRRPGCHGQPGRGHQRPLPAVAVAHYNGMPIYAFAQL